LKKLATGTVTLSVEKVVEAKNEHSAFEAVYNILNSYTSRIESFNVIDDEGKVHTIKVTDFGVEWKEVEDAEEDEE